MKDLDDVFLYPPTILMDHHLTKIKKLNEIIFTKYVFHIEIFHSTHWVIYEREISETLSKAIQEKDNCNFSICSDV